MDNLGWWKKTRAVFLLGSELMIVLAILAATALAQQEQAFSFQGSNGSRPQGGLTADTAGNIYGTASTGGLPLCANGSGCGVVFEFIPPSKQGGAWTELTLYSFTGSPDGAVPNGDLIVDSTGNLFGTTQSGGTNDAGVAFELFPPSQPGGTWSEQVIYSFGATSTDGQEPLAGLIIDGKGNLYGTTSGGGSGMFGLSGTAFQLSPPSQNGSWSETVLYNFGAFPGDGSSPRAPLTFDSAGNLYGTAFFGGTNSTTGTAFQLVPPQQPGDPWTETILHSFGSPLGDGTSPVAGLTVTPSGALLGMTSEGGLFDDGVVFGLAPPSSPGANWGYAILYRFTGAPDGGKPQGPLTLVPGKFPVLYGTTIKGGPFDDGVVFQLTPPAPGGAWIETPVYSFTGGNDGARPASGVLIHNYALYGTTLNGGTHSLGTAFRLSR